MVHRFSEDFISSLLSRESHAKSRLTGACFCCLEEKRASSSHQEALYRLTPLSARGVTVGDFTGPGTRQVLWWPDEEDELLSATCALDLLVEFSRLFRGIPSNVEHDEIVDIGLPQKACCGESFGFMHLDSVTSQDGRARLARSLAAVDEENFLPKKIQRISRLRSHGHIPSRSVAACHVPYLMPAALSRETLNKPVSLRRCVFSMPVDALEFV